MHWLIHNSEKCISKLGGEFNGKSLNRSDHTLAFKQRLAWQLPRYRLKGSKHATDKISAPISLNVCFVSRIDRDAVPP